LFDVLAWAKEGFKRSWASVGFFEDMGITYIGVLDGHDLADLEESFERAFAMRTPVLVHVKTVKGRGYAPAEQDSVSFHGASLPPVDLTLIDPTEEPLPTESAPRRKPKTYTHTFVEELVRLAEADARICAITAGMPTGTGLSRFADRFPERFFDVGIAEQHSVTMATGLALAASDRWWPCTLPSASAPTTSSSTTSARTMRRCYWPSIGPAWWARTGRATRACSRSPPSAPCPTW
jgi:1-deoxy-D-xylulose-5-phosphate synthase